MEPSQHPAAEPANASGGSPTAPPEPDDRNRVPTGLTREYRSGFIRVQWYADRCIHSADCILALPRVFNPRRRPWIDLEAASADAIAAAVELCPTGALHYLRVDGGPQEAEPDGVTLQVVRNGPYLLHGRVRIVDDEGRVTREDSRIALCRCGESQHMPFCDNSHRASGFRDDT